VLNFNISNQFLAYKKDVLTKYSEIRMRITHCTRATHSLLTPCHRTLSHRLVLGKAQIFLSKSALAPFRSNPDRTSIQPFGTRFLVVSFFHASTRRTGHWVGFGAPFSSTNLTHGMLHRRIAFHDVIRVFFQAHDTLHSSIIDQAPTFFSILIPP
jgi:hypothetical protein